jgi:hypothetical protein
VTSSTPNTSTSPNLTKQTSSLAGGLRAATSG